MSSEWYSGRRQNSTIEFEPATRKALVDDVLGFVGDKGSQVRALEVGAGTGKATVPFALRGLEIVALEPSVAMAAVAKRNCQRFPQVRIELTTFEDWPLEPAGFNLLFSAQAWHWVRRDVRMGKAAEALSPGGTLALFWHRTDWHGEDLRAELEELYRRVAPELYVQTPGFPGLTPTRGDDEQSAEIATSDLFRDLTVRNHHWSAAFTADTFVELLLTQSNHRLLPDHTRAELIDAVHALIDRQGEEVVVPHATFLLLARAR